MRYAIPYIPLYTVFRMACLGVLLSGCVGNAPVTPSGRLVGPVAWAMEPAEPIVPPKEGDDAKESLGQCYAKLANETAKLPPLQTFARRVTRKPQS